MAVATTSQLAADAAAEVAECGGNAVDCAVAASMLSANTQPGVCALAGGAYVTVWHPDKEPITIDGNVAVPGIEADAGYDADHGLTLQMEYGGGIRTVIGGASVAVPGTLAALEKASQDFGTVNWKDTLRPAIRAVADGFPLSEACHYYLGYSAAPIFSRSTDGFKALHDDNGSLLESGAAVVVPHLADSLAAIAAEGSRLFYEGDLAAKIAEHVRDAGGTLTRTDLASYKAIVRPALSVVSNGWRIATNPPPAVGGAMLGAMLLGFVDDPITSWDRDAIAHLIAVQLATLSYRKNQVDLADDVGAAANRLLKLATNGQFISRWSSASTVHTSAVDSSGLACAITASSGYGSGEMPAGTGLWLNNCLGELELNRRGLAAGPLGARLPSNMAPGVARQDQTVLAFGSPGADRITTALHQFLINYTQIGCDLDEAIAYPRLHIDVNGERPKLSHEPGIDLPLVDIDVVPYPSTNMYFGGVAAATFDGADRLQAAADPRREGGTFIDRG